MHTKNSVSTHVLEPMTKDRAATLVTRLLGSYASLNLHDPETYMAELVVLFLKYPQWVGEQAIVDAKRASPQFVPSVPLVEQAAEEAFGQTRHALTYGEEWDERSRRQLQERAAIERAEKEEDPEYRRQVIARLWPRALEKKDEREITETKKFRQFTQEELTAIYRAKNEPAERS